MSRASKNVYHPNGDANDFRTVEDALDALKPFSGILQYFSGLTDPGADRIMFWDDSAGVGAWLTPSGMTISGTSISVDAATTSAAGIIEQATSAEYQGNTSGNLALTPANVWSAVGYTALTDGTSIPVDMGTGFNFSVTIAGNRTLANPSNAKPGQSGCFKVTASGGTRTIDVGTNYLFTTDLDFPVSIASGDIAYIFYFVDTSSRILITSVLNDPS